jgi:hypothetical protein
MKRAIVVILLLLVICLLAWAETYEHKEGGLSIWFPDDWSVNAEGNSLEADAPDGDAYIQFLMLNDVTSLEDAVNSLVKELDPLVKDFLLTNDGQDTEYNGLKFYLVEGQGLVEGVNMGVSVALVSTPKGNTAMMVLFCPTEIVAKYESQFQKIIANIKAL